MEKILGFFLLLGGIGLFLFGINFMSKGLENLAGSKLRVFLEKMTSTGFWAVIAGTVTTVLIQSSGATSVMAISFVNANLMNLSQALYVMLGANIGTTVTAQIIAFKIESIAPLILFIGAVMYLFMKDDLMRRIGGVVLGFGLLFVGIYLMGDAVNSLGLEAMIKEFLDTFSNPVFCLLFGIVITAVIQSSSASIGILQVLAMQSAAQIELAAVFYIILGMNIGACSPVILSSMGGNRSCRKSAISCLIAKALGAVIFIVIFLLFRQMIGFIESLSPGDVSRQIANLHLIFNLVSTVFLFPFVPAITSMLNRLIPDDPEAEKTAQKLLYINSETMIAPIAVSILQVKMEIMRMADLASMNLHNATEAFINRDEHRRESVLESEKTVDYLFHELTGVLVSLHNRNLDGKEYEQIGMMFRVVSDIERISDHAENIVEYMSYFPSSKSDALPFSAEAFSELKQIIEGTLATLDLAIQIYNDNAFDLLDKVSELEEQVDVMQDQFIQNHIDRLKVKQCDPRFGVIFTDMVTDLERCSDHAINIAFAIKGEKTSMKINYAYGLTRTNS